VVKRKKKVNKQKEKLKFYQISFAIFFLWRTIELFILFPTYLFIFMINPY